MDNGQMITIAGQIGSGKTEVSKILGDKTGREVISTGAILRGMAAQYGMTVLQLNDFAFRNPNIDHEIDGHLKALYERPRAAVVDARLGWYFIPSSFKVYLIVDPTIGAERILGALRPEEKYDSLDAAVVDILQRQKYENERFKRAYSVECDNWLNYDLVVDTSAAPPEQIASVILEAQKHGSKEQTDGMPQCWLSPKRLIPTQDIRELSGSRAEDVFNSVKTRGFDPEDAIDVAIYRGYFLIVDGHLRASAALRLAIPLVPCHIRGFESGPVVGDTDIARFAVTSTSLASIYDWEEAHRFRLRNYPKWLMAHQT